MIGKVVNFRAGQNTQSTNHIIVMPDGVKDKEKAAALIGKTAEWETPSGKKIVGKVRKVHGRNGGVIVKFNKGLPGQAIGTDVIIAD